MTNLKRLRTKRGLSLRALADRANVSYQTVWNWERGQTYPTHWNWPGLEAATGYPVTVLMSDDPALIQNEESAAGR